MKISIIIPVYNTECFLPRCIDSVLSQDYKDFEILLIDDGSKDGSGVICDNYAEKDSRVRVFHKENGGASSARNMGLDYAKGDWVTFIDSDDYILNNYISIPFDDSTDLYVQNWRYATGEYKDYYEPQVINRDEYNEFMKRNIHTDVFRTACCSFFKRKILCDNNIKFDTQYRLGEDTLFVMDYYKYARSIQIMDNSCYVYNRQEDWNNKYRLVWSEANDYLGAFMNRYESLHIEARDLLNFMFVFIYRKIDIDSRTLWVKWNLSKPVLKYKKHELPYRSFRYRMKYYIFKSLAMVVHV